jgi:hypothetical protein
MVKKPFIVVMVTLSEMALILVKGYAALFVNSPNKQILSPAKSAGCDVNPLRGFPR